VIRCSLLGGVVLVSVLGLPGSLLPQSGAALYPDLQVVLPQHLAIRTTPGQELLYFTNGIANRGDGPLRLRADPYPETTTETPPAIQEVLDARGRVVERQVVGVFVYSAEHAHWHLSDVARFELRIALDEGKQGRWGEVVRERSKETMCLLDFYKLDDPAAEKGEYAECAPQVQGISPGWVDQYYKVLPGQQLDVTGLPAGTYYLISTANPARRLLERVPDNNAAWVSFQLTRERGSPPRLALVGHSACDTPGMCGAQSLHDVDGAEEE
jgi:Lysyl oxidase